MKKIAAVLGVVGVLSLSACGLDAEWEDNASTPEEGGLGGVVKEGRVETSNGSYDCFVWGSSLTDTSGMWCEEVKMVGEE